MPYIESCHNNDHPSFLFHCVLVLVHIVIKDCSRIIVEMLTNLM